MCARDGVRRGGMMKCGYQGRVVVASQCDGFLFRGNVFSGDLRRANINAAQRSIGPYTLGAAWTNRRRHSRGGQMSKPGVQMRHHGSGDDLPSHLALG